MEEKEVVEKEILHDNMISNECFFEKQTNLQRSFERYIKLSLYSRDHVKIHHVNFNGKRFFVSFLDNKMSRQMIDTAENIP